MIHSVIHETSRNEMRLRSTIEGTSFFIRLDVSMSTSSLHFQLLVRYSRRRWQVKCPRGGRIVRASLVGRNWQVSQEQTAVSVRWEATFYSPHADLLRLVDQCERLNEELALSQSDPIEIDARSETDHQQSADDQTSMHASDCLLTDCVRGNQDESDASAELDDS